MNRALATIALLILSNTFMTLAWYGHIAFKSKIERFGMLSIILLSWGIALFEYCFQVPANRIGSSQLGCPFSIWELKVIQEVISLLAGTVTAFCGPIGFIGLAVPHVARILFADADHRILVPASILTGIVVMLLCDVLAKLLTFPINTITALLGIPIVIWVVIRNKSIV